MRNRDGARIGRRGFAAGRATFRPVSIHARGGVCLGIGRRQRRLDRGSENRPEEGPRVVLDAMEDEEDDGTLCTPRNIIRIFAEANLSCNLRVLGSQLGLDSSHLDEIEGLPYRQRTMEILERCFSSPQGLSWSVLVSVLRRPALREYSVAFSIERFTIFSRSTTSNSSSQTEPVLRSLSMSTSSPENSISSNMDFGEIYIQIQHK